MGSFLFWDFASSSFSCLGSDRNAGGTSHFVVLTVESQFNDGYPGGQKETQGLMMSLHTEGTEPPACRPPPRPSLENKPHPV